MTLVLLFSVLRPPAALSDPLRIVLPSVLYDVVLAVILGPLIVSSGSFSWLSFHVCPSSADR